MRIPEFVQICLEVGIEWEKISEIGWRCGGTYIYIPKFISKVECYRELLKSFEKEKKILGEAKALERISQRKNISKKKIKKLLAEREKLYLFN